MLKKTPSKVAQKSSNLFFLTAQTAQTEEFMFQNMTYWPTVYRTGVRTIPRHRGADNQHEKSQSKNGRKHVLIKLLQQACFAFA